MMNISIKGVIWRTEPEPAPRYRNICRKPWPAAWYVAAGAGQRKAKLAAIVECPDAYEPTKALTGEHAPLILRVCDHSTNPWTWRSLKTRFETLVDAKQTLAAFLEKNPEFAPIEQKNRHQVFCINK
jgi:hypothetical protein